MSDGLFLIFSINRFDILYELVLQGKRRQYPEKRFCLLKRSVFQRKEFTHLDYQITRSCLFIMSLEYATKFS